MKTRLTVCALTIVVASACSDGNPAGPDKLDANSPPVVVSEAHAHTSASLSSPGVASLSSASSVAYVSAPPGTLPRGLTVTIRNKSTGGSATTANIVDGGFDPVPIAATTGDELSLTVMNVDGGSVVFTSKVPQRRPPVVVRTNPTKGRTDIALTQVVTVVFSEPVDSSTVTGASVRLLNGAQQIGASIATSANAVLMTLTPNARLEPATTYSLIIGQQIRDADGDALEAADTVTFTTENSFTPSGPSSVRIVFSRGDNVFDGETHLYAMNADGSDLRQLTSGAFSDNSPSVSPDGKRIVFSRNDSIYVMNSDGSDAHGLGISSTDVSWSPDGSKVVFSDPSTTGISVANDDGTGIVHLTDASVSNKNDSQPRWSPDGQKIAFMRWVDLEFSLVYVMNADGTGVRQLGRQEESGGLLKTWACWTPVWSADSQRIAFAGPTDALTPGIFTMNPDGSNVGTISEGMQGIMAELSDWAGEWIAFTMNATGADIYLLKGTTATRITNDGHSSSASILSR